MEFNHDSISKKGFGSMASSTGRFSNKLAYTGPGAAASGALQERVLGCSTCSSIGLRAPGASQRACGGQLSSPAAVGGLRKAPWGAHSRCRLPHAPPARPHHERRLPPNLPACTQAPAPTGRSWLRAWPGSEQPPAHPRPSSAKRCVPLLCCWTRPELWVWVWVWVWVRVVQGGKNMCEIYGVSRT